MGFSHDSRAAECGCRADKKQQALEAEVQEGLWPPVARDGTGNEQRARGNWMLLQGTIEKE